MLWGLKIQLEALVCMHVRACMCGYACVYVRVRLRLRSHADAYLHKHVYRRVRVCARAEENIEELRVYTRALDEKALGKSQLGRGVGREGSAKYGS